MATRKMLKIWGTRRHLCFVESEYVTLSLSFRRRFKGCLQKIYLSPSSQTFSQLYWVMLQKQIVVLFIHYLVRETFKAEGKDSK